MGNHDTEGSRQGNEEYFRQQSLDNHHSNKDTTTKHCGHKRRLEDDSSSLSDHLESQSRGRRLRPRIGSIDTQHNPETQDHHYHPQNSQSQVHGTTPRRPSSSTSVQPRPRNDDDAPRATRASSCTRGKELIPHHLSWLRSRSFSPSTSWSFSDSDSVESYYAEGYRPPPRSFGCLLPSRTPNSTPTGSEGNNEGYWYMYDGNYDGSVGDRERSITDRERAARDRAREKDRDRDRELYPERYPEGGKDEDDVRGGDREGQGQGIDRYAPADLRMTTGVYGVGGDRYGDDYGRYRGDSYSYYNDNSYRNDDRDRGRDYDRRDRDRGYNDQDRNNSRDRNGDSYARRDSRGRDYDHNNSRDRDYDKQYRGYNQDRNSGSGRRNRSNENMYRINREVYLSDEGRGFPPDDQDRDRGPSRRRRNSDGPGGGFVDEDFENGYKNWKRRNKSRKGGDWLLLACAAVVTAAVYKLVGGKRGKSRDGCRSEVGDASYTDDEDRDDGRDDRRRRGTSSRPRRRRIEDDDEDHNLDRNAVARQKRMGVRLKNRRGSISESVSLAESGSEREEERRQRRGDREEGKERRDRDRDRDREGSGGGGREGRNSRVGLVGVQSRKE